MQASYTDTDSSVVTTRGRGQGWVQASRREEDGDICDRVNCFGGSRPACSCGFGVFMGEDEF